MSRHKKSRQPGSTGDTDLIVTRNRSQSDVDGRLRKKEKKRKGLKTGNRHSEASTKRDITGREIRDPRIGSKKKIQLVVEKASKATPTQRKLNAQQELDALENDAQLNVLLDRIDNGESLGAGLQSYVDEKLDRIEVLMKQVGLLEPEFEPEVESKPMTTKVKSKSKSEADLLAEFEDLDLSDFEG
ncbi:Der GTPase-activating protein YihI [Vibrio gallicus]|uniref:Der GTPase-activating protein YihI n=1 Tax=Vibrio gallicus TaxID=190897 RepID=UPI0021C2AA1A|nr:Der GTPase-activating protein YihI [Vibrio gallicus]